MSSDRSPDPLRALLADLGHVKQTAKGWQARCPAHDDHVPSLSIALSQNGETILVKCHAGCSTEAVLAAVGMKLRDLFRGPWLHPPRLRPSAPVEGVITRRVVATYDYTDRDGKLVFQVVRYEPKTFRQRRPDGKGGWIWNLDGVTIWPLYRLPAVLNAKPSETIFVVEGEKDADRLAREGLTATTNSGGAGKWREENTMLLTGRKVLVICDNDAAGQKHGKEIARLLALANEREHHDGTIRIWTPPDVPEKGDVSDWFAAGGTRESLLQAAETAPLCQGDDSSGTEDNRSGPLLTKLADVPAKMVTWLWPGRLARGKLAIVDGDPGLGKSLVTLDLAARVSAGRPFPDEAPGNADSVVIVNCEDGVADTIRPRLEALGANLDRVHVLHGPTFNGHELLPSFPRDLLRLEEAVRRTEAALVIIDPVMAFLDEHICSSNDQSVRQALAPLASMAERTGAAIVLVRHLNKVGGAKAVYRGGGSIGIIGACRSAWLIARHPTDDRQRVLAQVKNNLAKPQPSLGYELVSDELGRPQVAWLGVVDLAADELVGHAAAVAELPELERAVGLLRECLANGPRPVADLMAELSKQRVSRATLFRAKKEAGVESQLEKTATGSRAIWRLADTSRPTDRTDPSSKYIRDILNHPGPYLEKY
jgi:hypothetical protein